MAVLTESIQAGKAKVFLGIRINSGHCHWQIERDLMPSSC